MISTVNSVNLSHPLYISKTQSPNFGKKVRITKTPSMEKFSVSAEKFSKKAKFLNKFRGITKAFFQREYIFDDNSGKLVRSIRYGEKLGLSHVPTKIKSYDPKTGKLCAMDIYKNNKLAESCGYYDNGKIMKWHCRYTPEKETLHEFYPNGINLKALQTDVGLNTYRMEYDEATGRVSKEIRMYDGEPVEIREYEKNAKTIKNYENGKLKNSVTDCETGKVKQKSVIYDENENPVKAEYIYFSEGEHAEVIYTKDTIVSTRYFNDQVLSVETTDRKSGKKHRVFKSSIKKS